MYSGKIQVEKHYCIIYFIILTGRASTIDDNNNNIIVADRCNFHGGCSSNAIVDNVRGGGVVGRVSALGFYCFPVRVRCVVCLCLYVYIIYIHTLYRYIFIAGSGRSARKCVWRWSPPTPFMCFASLHKNFTISRARYTDSVVYGNRDGYIILQCAFCVCRCFLFPRSNINISWSSRKGFRSERGK